MTLVSIRLAFSGWSTRKLQIFLTMTVVGASAAAIAVALHITSIAGSPWDETFERTNGAHLVFHVFREGPGFVDAAAIEREPLVSAVRGPLPVAFTSFDLAGQRQGVRTIAFGSGEPAIDQPVVVAGRWLSEDGADEIVLERSFAKFIDAEPGAVVRFGTGDAGVTALVVGVAVSTLEDPYPQTWPGLAFVTPAVGARLVPFADLVASTLFVRLSDPAATVEVAASPGVSRLAARFQVETWQHRRSESLQLTHVTRVILTTFGVIILVVTAFVVVTLVGGRVAAQRQEIALWRAVGFSPGQVARVVLLEAVTVAGVGGVAGAFLGVFLAPRLAGSPAELLGSVEPRLDFGFVAVAALSPVAATALVTFGAIQRGLRRPAAQALQTALPTPSGRLAVPLTLLRGSPAVVAGAMGIRDALARRGRFVAGVAAAAVTLACIVAGLSMEATFRSEDAISQTRLAASGLAELPAGAPPAGTDDRERSQARSVVHGLNALLSLLALANLYAVSTLSYRERQRELGLLRALGFGPREVWASVVSGASAAALVALAIGVPLGVALFRAVYFAANGDVDAVVLPEWIWLAVLAPASWLAMVAIGMASAAHAVRLPASEALRHE